MSDGTVRLAQPVFADIPIRTVKSISSNDAGKTIIHLKGGGSLCVEETVEEVTTKLFADAL